MALISCDVCGRMISELSSSCPNCGHPTRRQHTPSPVVTVTDVRADDHSSFGYALLGFLIPIVGLVLYLVWQNDKPARAASVGKGALVGAGLWLLSVVIL